jgi:hypothetical protein
MTVLDSEKTSFPQSTAVGASFRHQGLHPTLGKRYSSGLQFAFGYAWAKNFGLLDGGFPAFDDYLKAYGNIPNIRRHRL